MEELRKKLMEELKNKLGEGYEVSPVDVNKNNGTILHGISIMLKGNIGGPTVYVDNFYQRFQGTNEEIEEMIDYILEDIRSCYEIDDEELQRNVYEYDRAKEHLRVALCNYEATTVHKSQGSEYKVVILPWLPMFYMMLRRNILYTAITRAKEKIVIVGSKKALYQAIHNTACDKRNTRLGERIVREYNALLAKKASA